MRINTRTVWQINADGSMTLLERESYDYTGPVAQAFGGRSKTVTETTQEVTTTQLGLEDIEGIGIAAVGDVEFTQTVTDLGAVQGAFDFATDIGRQAGETAQQAVATSRQAIATVATGGQVDLQKISGNTIALVAAAFAAVFIIPQLLKRT